MLIALLHIPSADPDETLAEQLRALGHEVERVEASSSFEHAAARLRALLPDLVLDARTPGFANSGLWPAICVELGLAYVVAAEGDLAAILARVEPKRVRVRREGLRVGLLHNLKRDRGDEHQAEFDSPATIEAIASALRELGHEPIKLEATRWLPGVLDETSIDVAFNIAEGLVGRSREAQVPALLDMLQIPYTGSDPVSLAICLDKGLAKRVVELAGVTTPRGLLMRSATDRLPDDLRYPLLAKPVAEGSSKGVLGKSVVRDEQELRALVGEIVRRYDQPALVEDYLPGREFTVGLLGNEANQPVEREASPHGGRRPSTGGFHGRETNLRVLPAMEIVFTDSEVAHPVYSYGHKTETETGVRFEVPAKLDAALEREIAECTTQAFKALGCRDGARIDLRLDARGRVHFLECNPLPGLSPGFSDLCVIAEAAGISYVQLIGMILEPAIQRMGGAGRGHA
jgi:D-alanine-D-alanine ligase-like ATP-grasp enzyme